jgi:hypothetical protein
MCQRAEPRRRPVGYLMGRFGASHASHLADVLYEVILVCRIEQRSLISLLNTAKKQPGLSPSPQKSSLFGCTDREITAKTVADLGCRPL